MAIALPIIAEEFKVSLAEVSWVDNSFLIALASAVLIAGRVGDWLRRGRVLLLALLYFLATSLAMLIINSYNGLLAYRFHFIGLGSLICSL
ncbi:MAG: MFS transporter [Candidatus Methanodesulfokora sp.]